MLLQITEFAVCAMFPVIKTSTPHARYIYIKLYWYCFLPFHKEASLRTRTNLCHCYCDINIATLLTHNYQHMDITIIAT